MYDLRDAIIPNPANCDKYVCDCNGKGEEEIISLVGWSNKTCDWTDVCLQTIADAILAQVNDCFIDSVAAVADAATCTTTLTIKFVDACSADEVVVVPFPETVCDDTVLTVTATSNTVTDTITICYTLESGGAPVCQTIGLSDCCPTFSFNGVLITPTTIGGQPNYNLNLGITTNGNTTGVTLVNNIWDITLLGDTAGNILTLSPNGGLSITCEQMQDCIGQAVMAGAGITYDDLMNAYNVTISNATACTTLNAITTPVTDMTGYRVPVMNGTTCGYTDWIKKCGGSYLLGSDEVIVKTDLDNDGVPTRIMPDATSNQPRKRVRVDRSCGDIKLYETVKERRETGTYDPLNPVTGEHFNDTDACGNLFENFCDGTWQLIKCAKIEFMGFLATDWVVGDRTNGQNLDGFDFYTLFSDHFIVPALCAVPGYEWKAIGNIGTFWNSSSNIRWEDYPNDDGTNPTEAKLRLNSGILKNSGSIIGPGGLSRRRQTSEVALQGNTASYEAFGHDHSVSFEMPIVAGDAVGGSHIIYTDALATNNGGFQRIWADIRGSYQLFEI